MTYVPQIDDVLSARDRLSGHAVRTPLLYSPVLSERLAADVFLKPECLQRTGSFKFRGAWNASNAVDPAQREAGFVAVSSGNHAQGVAEAARLLGVDATIVMPADAPAPKIERTKRSGARIVTFDRATGDRDEVVARVIDEIGGTLIHPFDNPHVIAGQGTVGLEIAEDCAALGVQPDAVLVPCSGGGLSSGIALALGERVPEAQVFIAEPEDFDDYARSLAAGTLQKNDVLSGSVCDALLVQSPGALGFEINRKRLAGAHQVSDAEALFAVGFAFDELRLVVEPGGAAGLAALLAGRLDAEAKAVVVVLSGGNVGDDMLAEGLRVYRTAAAEGVLPQR